MNEDHVEQAIRTILVEDFGVPEALIRPEATFQGSLGLDSLDVVDFILLLQKDLGFEAPTSAYRALGSYQALVDFAVGRVESARGMSEVT